MKNGLIERILIVGGGSSGWMTASYLRTLLPEIEVTLVEAPGIPTVGVGEATIATFSWFLSALGLKDEEWMPSCDASYKYQIRFKNWYRQDEEFWHPFEPFVYHRNALHLGHFSYLKSLLNDGLDRGNPFFDALLSTELAKNNQVLRTPGAPSYFDNFSVTVDGAAIPIRVPYAYHFDASRFGEYLKNHVALPKGVQHVVGEVQTVHQDERGFITSVVTKDQEQHAADLFVDCTGFRAMLIEGVMKNSFQSYDDTLFCDRAIAMSVPYEDIQSELEPFTTADARSNGWIWNIPLLSRRGAGYVYSSSFQSDDDAELEFRKALGERRVQDVDARRIKMRIGQTENFWDRNCVAIGLSSGFIEPLESTGLHLVYASICQLTDLISERSCNAGIIASYNHFMNSLMKETRDFVAAHYALTSREDTDFWRAAKFDTKISDSLAEMLVASKNLFPNRLKSLLFPEHSWTCILAGMNYFPGPQSYRPLNSPAAKLQFALMEEIGRLRSRLQKSAPNHYQWLKQQNAVEN